MGSKAGLTPAASPEEGAPGEAEMDVPAPLARAARLALDRKARDAVLLDLRNVSNATDYFLILSGNSDTHVKGVAEYVLEELRREGVRANHVEGLRSGRWVLIDYFDFVVHVFHPEARSFYQLENLWGDAPQERLTE
ncbi:MAG TPA: ribosome silencing factor [Longimicrobiales bacterium]|nr:ribosome silencing factor [Longimicrobiales bacterium]